MKNRLLKAIRFICTTVFIFLNLQVLDASDFQTFNLSPPPGNYSRDTTVFMNPKQQTTDIFYCFDNDAHDHRVSYTMPLKLSALTGEKREYTLHITADDGVNPVEKHTVTYIIDKRKPPVPETNHPSGFYQSAIDISFKTRNADLTIVYSINAPITDDSIRWNGEPIVFTNDNSNDPQAFTLFAYSMDEAGNTSRVNSWTYTIFPKTKIVEKELETYILSPVEGTFANKQLLYIQTEEFEWIKFSTNNSDPSENGSTYRGPIELRETGEVLLKVAAKTKRLGKVLHAQIPFSVRLPDQSISSSIHNGRYTDPVEVSFSSQSPLLYTFDERTPTNSDPTYSTPFVLKPLQKGIKLYTLRVLPTFEGEVEYRYFLVFDDRTPIDPVIQVHNTLPLSNQTMISIWGSPTSTIYYTLDGTRPDRSSLPYSEPFTLEIPTEQKSGTLTVQARSYRPNGKASNQVTKLITYDTKRPSTPVVTLDAERSTQSEYYLQFTTDEEVDIVYEFSLTETPPPQPDVFSPRWNRYETIAVPYGKDQTFVFRFAAVDSAGNISEPTDPISYSIDRRPPNIPVIQFDEETGTLRMESESDATIYYTMKADGSIPQLPDKQSAIYSEPISVPLQEDQINRIGVYSIAVDQYGNASRITDLYSFSVDRRTPRMPAIRGVEQGGVYNRQDITIRFDVNEPGLGFIYSYTKDSTEPPDPDPSQSLTADNLTFKGEDNKAITYRVKIAPVLRSNERVGKIHSIHFTIDLEQPDAPIPKNLTPVSVHNKMVTIDFESNNDSKDTIFYSIFDDRQKPSNPFGQEGRIAQGPILLDIPEDSEYTFFLRFGSQDEAGNRTLNEQIYQLTIDKKPPALPVVNGIPISGLSKTPITINVDANGNKVFYELVEEQYLPTENTWLTKELSGPLNVSGKPDQEGTYYFHCQSEDMAGNRSQKLVSYFFTIDRKSPGIPPYPIVDRTEGAIQYTTILWPDIGENTIWYSIEGLGVPRTDFQPYNGPILMQQYEGTVNLSFFAKDTAGNTSSVLSYAVRMDKRHTGTYISGVQHNGLYNNEVVITNTAEYGVVRFEVAEAEQSLDEVTRFSPILPNTYTFSISEGETITYRLQTKLFDTLSDPIGKRKTSFQFTIDRHPPPIPTIGGVKHNGFYQEDQRILIEAEEGTIYYSLADDEQEEKATETNAYQVYEGPIDVSTEEGKRKTYLLTAFTEDSSGNKSKVTQKVIFTIDKKILYVSNRLGNDYYDGTREKPFKTLKKALQTSKDSYRNTVYIGEERQSINDPLILMDDITIVGGFNPESWTKDRDSVTIFEPGKYFPEGNDLFSIKKGSIVLSHIRLEDPLHYTNRLFIIEGGTISLSRVHIQPPKTYLDSAIKISGGKTLFNDCRIHYPKIYFNSLIEANQAELTITNSNFSFDELSDQFTLLKLAHCPSISIENTEIDMGMGKKITGMDIDHSTVVCKDTTIAAGNGSVQAVGIKANNSELSLERSNITSSPNGRMTTCLSVDNSTVAIRSSIINGNARIGATAVYAKASTIDIRKSTISCEKTREFLYLIKLYNCKSQMYNSYFVTENSPYLIGMEFQRSNVKFFHNNCFFDRGEHIDIGMLITNCDEPLILNNIILKRGTINKISTALHIEESPNIEIRSNNIAGWNAVLGIDGKDVHTINDLNLLDDDPLGGVFHGNIQEKYEDIFSSTKLNNYTLKESSACVNSGVNVVPYGGPDEDRDGQPRPNPYHGVFPAFDIGSDEYYKE